MSAADDGEGSSKQRAGDHSLHLQEVDMWLTSGALYPSEGVGQVVQEAKVS